MSSYDVGDVTRLTATFVNAAGVPTNTTVTLTIQEPDGTLTTPSPVSDGAGVYHADVVLDASGVWAYRWVGTGAVATSEDGEVYVARSRVTA